MAADAPSTRVRLEAWTWLAQRASAAVLAVCVVVHLATMIVAVRGGLTGAEILARTRGSVVVGGFYALFVVAVTVHAPLGLRTLLAEWAGLRGRGWDAALLLFALMLLVGGLNAVRAVTA